MELRNFRVTEKIKTLQAKISQLNIYFCELKNLKKTYLTEKLICKNLYF